jgi:predicted  nucleic acid-binding Zn-ribbon protein
MNNTLKKLLELQVIDADLIQLKHKLDCIPEELRREQHEYESSVNKAHSGAVRHKEMEATQMHLQLEIDSAIERVKELKGKQAQVKKNQEYQALTHEIKQAEINLEKQKHALVQKKEDSKENDEQMEALQQKIETDKEALLSKARDARKPLQEFQTKLNRCKKIRQELTRDIKPDALELYARLMKTRAPRAVVTANGNVCSGCNINLPPQVVGDIMKADRLVICENCARILYIAEDAGE